MTTMYIMNKLIYDSTFKCCNCGIAIVLRADSKAVQTKQFERELECWEFKVIVHKQVHRLNKLWETYNAYSR